MVRIPSAEDLGIGEVETRPASSAFFSIRTADTRNIGTGAEFMGRQLQSLGESFAGLAAEVAERRTETALREEQQHLDEFEMNMINPREGLFSRTGSAASGLTNDVEAAFEEYLQDAEDRLRAIGSASGRSAVLNMISGVRSRMYRRAAQYEIQQLEAASRAAASSRRATAQARARFGFTDTEEVESALVIAASTAEEEARARGLQGEEFDSYVRYATGEVIGAQIEGATAAGAHVYARDRLADAMSRGLINPEYAASMIDELHDNAVEQEAEFHAERARGIAAGNDIEVYTGRDPTEFVGTVMPSGMFVAATETRTGPGQGPGQGGVISGPQGADISQTEVVGGGDPDALDPRGEAYRAGRPTTPERAVVEENLRQLQEIDMVIDNRDLMRLGYTRDGLRAMMAYGGVDAAINYIHTAGAFNPEVTPDGQRLSDIYQSYTPQVSGQFGTDYQIAEQYFDTIQDPEIREKAREVYQREVEADDWARERVQRDAMRTAISALEEFSQMAPEEVRNARFEDFFGPEDLDRLGPVNAQTVRTRFDQIRRGIVDPPTNEDVYNRLYTMSEIAPDEFVQEELGRYQADLSQADRRFLAERQAALRGEAIEEAEEGSGPITPFTPTDLRNAIGGATAALPSDEAGQVERLVHDYAIYFQRQHGRRPSEIELYDYADRIVRGQMGDRGVFGISGMSADDVLDLDADGLESFLERDDLVLDVQGPGGTRVEVPIRPEDIRRQAALMEAATGVQPRPSVVLGQLAFILGQGQATGLTRRQPPPTTRQPPPNSPAAGGSPFGN